MKHSGVEEQNKKGRTLFFSGCFHSIGFDCHCSFYIKEANRVGYYLVAFLMLLCIIILIILMVFYRNQQRQVENARQQAEEANKAKSSFLFNMSHDIRTPMNEITGFTDRAIRNRDNPKVLNESLEKVKDSSTYLLRIIREIKAPEGIHMPIIAMTANAFGEDRRDALASGMDDHIAKPIDTAKLIEILSTHIKKNVY